MKKILLFLSPVLLLSSCALFGLHINLHNPKHQSEYPKFSEETILLGETNALRANYDVTFYDLDIDFDIENKSITGSVEIKAIAVKDIDSMQFDLDEPMEISKINWKTRDGEVIPYKRNFRQVLIKLPQRVLKGQTFSIHVLYSGKPVEAKKPPWKGGLVWKKDKEKHPWVGVACETEGASIWFPCKDMTNDEPDSVYMRYTTKGEGLSIVGNGQFVNMSRDHDLNVFEWKVSYPINVYDISFYIGDFENISEEYTGINGKTMNLSYWVLRPNVERAKKHFRQVKDILKIYEETYGEYPWYNDGFKLVESPYEGMEHQTAIAYGNGYRSDIKGEIDYIILHETGHEWFGNAITAADLADVWLQEGITTYGESVYLEKKYDMDEANFHLMFYRWTVKNQLPLVGPKGRRYFDFRDGDVYVKGAWMMHTLRNQMNDDSLFFSVLKTFFQENKYKVTDSDKFVETVNRVTGKDYTWFFNQYLHRNTSPMLEYYGDENGNLYFRWVDANDDFDKMVIHTLYARYEFSAVVVPSTSVQMIHLPIEDYSLFSFDGTKGLFGMKENKKLEKIYEEENNDPDDRL